MNKYSREDFAKTYLPAGLILIIDNVIEIDGSKILCEQLVTTEHWIFPLHFPNDPVFPGSLMIEASAQTIAIWGWEQGLRGRPRLVKCTAEFIIPIPPGNFSIMYKGVISKRKNVCVGTIEVLVNNKVTGIITQTVVILQD